MGKIHVLDISVANLIAAGEVVDRPASAIKEMMENSIDAHATEITVEIRNGGSSFMRVTDNGCGMDADDAQACIKRHATSKIRLQGDLDNIATLGFRGEALAAIASVSDFRMLTRRHGDEMGTLLRSEAGEIVEFCPTGCPEGTTIIAQALFANIPARRKFLKKDITETAAVVATVEKIALSHPEIAVRLITDGTLRFNTAGDNRLANAIHAVLGRELAKKLASVDDTTEGIRVWGYVASPEYVRGNRNYENFFINGRYVKSSTATAALEQAFQSYCPVDKYPCCVLNITIHPSLVDVNVHPAKMEVKFSNEKMIFHAIYCAVRNALQKNISRPEPASLPMQATGDDLKGLGDLITYKAESAQAAMQISLDRERLTVPYKQITTFDADPTLPAQLNTMTVETEPVEEATPVSAPVSEPTAVQTQAGENPFLHLIPPFAPDPITIWEAIVDEHTEQEITLRPIGEALVYEHNSEYHIPADYDPYLTLLRQAAIRQAAAPETPPETDLKPAPAQNTDDFLPDLPSDFGSGFGAELLALSGSGEFLTSEEATVSCATAEGSLPEKTVPASIETPPPTAEAPVKKTEETLLPLPFYRIGGIVFHCYVFVELVDKMLLIDKHAAHERILFEQLKANMEKAAPSAQLLLLPFPLSLSVGEAAAVREYEREIRAIGFDFAEEDGALSLTQVPTELDTPTAAEAFAALAGNLAAGTATAAISRHALYEKALFQASCKAAVKAGKEDEPDHIRWIVEQVLTRPAIRYCPHGRPVALEMTKSQVEHLFHRP